MKPSDRILWGLLVGVFIGVLIGVLAHQLGFNYACPSKTCVDSADVTPITNRDYFEQAHRVLSEAKETIHIASYEVKYYSNYPNSLQNRLARDLIYAKERGVEVKVIVDEFSTENNAYKILKANGIEIKYDGPKTTTHTKLIIVDGKIIILGSTNLSYYGLEKNNEANILIEDGKTAQYFEKYFQQLWKNN